MGEKKHEHVLPPGYLGEPPEQADPHDHRTSPPVTPEPSLHTHAMPGLGICEECWRENPGAASFPAVPIGTRCDRHEADRLMAPIVDQHLAPLRAAMAEPRWHEIATEGLPAPDVDVLVFGWADNIGEAFTVVAHHDSRREAWEDDDWRSVHGVTHWMPLPAPPTKEPR